MGNTWSWRVGASLILLLIAQGCWLNQEIGQASPDADTAECYHGDYEIDEQADIAALQPYPCIVGSLSVDADLTSLALPNLEWVDGMVVIKKTGSVKDLEGLGSLKRVEGDFLVKGKVDGSDEWSDRLASLDGLDSLERIGGNLLLQSGDLENTDGLESLIEVGGSLFVRANMELLSLEGLSGLGAVGGSLWVWNNDSLASMHGLENISSIGGSLHVSLNDSLTDLEGLLGIAHVPDDLEICANSAITSLDGTSNLESVGGHVWINYNKVLGDVSAMGSLDEVGGPVEIFGNHSLPQCDICDLLFQLDSYDGYEFFDNMPDECNDDCE